MKAYYDNAIPIIPVDYSYHTLEHPFCWDRDCPCHTDKEAINDVKRFYDAGLLTAEEAENTIQGRILC